MLGKKEEHEEIKQFKANKDKFLELASKCHPNPLVYAEYIERQSLKKQKHGEKLNEKHSFNSTTPKNKETIKTERCIYNH